MRISLSLVRILKLFSSSLCLLALFTSCTNTKKDDVVSAPFFKVTYKADIQPIISSNCYSCNSAKATEPSKPGYAYLDNFEELKQYALIPSFVNSSYTQLQARIRYIELTGMPYKNLRLMKMI